ncbi:MAG: hypothetical protein R2865_15690 [Deinococcales bacterium]
MDGDDIYIAVGTIAMIAVMPLNGILAAFVKRLANVGAPNPAPIQTLIQTPTNPNTGIWRPTPGTSWQWQLSGALDLSFDVDAYNLIFLEHQLG